MQAEDALVQVMPSNSVASHTLLPGLTALRDTAAVLAAWQGLAATALLFLLYTALALRGYWQWRRDEQLAIADGN